MAPITSVSISDILQLDQHVSMNRSPLLKFKPVEHGVDIALTRVAGVSKDLVLPLVGVSIT